MLNAGKHIVCIDDDDQMLRALERTLVAAGFRVTTTSSPKDALTLGICEHADAVVADLYMPEMGGDLLLAMLAQGAPRTARVLITSENDFSRVAALTVPYAVHAFVAKQDISARLVPILREVLAGRPELDETVLSNEARGLARTIIHALALREYETVDHCERVAAWSRRLAAELQLSTHRQLDIELGALLHDVGQIGIRDAVLFKPGRLTEEEWNEVRSHPDLGVALISEVPALRRAIPIIQCHHERYDGNGYPRQLAGHAIPIDARIFQIADTYDAIVRGGPYRKAQTDQYAREEIAANVGAQFDPEVHDAFFRISPEEWASLANR
ncbi:MAG TPA: HD domain-containing phosphohydrolase [Labilithrix sp.]|nr:HD domain-containing phosphohydrolase [Labilithrix sp.]